MTMKTIKVAEATERQLNWLVARIEGDELPKSGGKGLDYSSDWAHGGPIIERERISIRPDVSTPNFRAFVIRPPEGMSHRYIGPTPLIAAMRCYVASKLGNQINVPEELL